MAPVDANVTKEKAHTAISRKVVGKSARDNQPVVLSSLFSKEIWKNGTRGHGRMFASAKGKQQK